MNVKLFVLFQKLDDLNRLIVVNWNQPIKLIQEYYYMSNDLTEL